MKRGTHFCLLSYQCSIIHHIDIESNLTWNDPSINNSNSNLLKKNRIKLKHIPLHMTHENTNFKTCIIDRSSEIRSWNFRTPLISAVTPNWIAGNENLYSFNPYIKSVQFHPTFPHSFSHKGPQVGRCLNHAKWRSLHKNSCDKSTDGSIRPNRDEGEDN